MNSPSPPVEELASVDNVILLEDLLVIGLLIELNPTIQKHTKPGKPKTQHRNYVNILEFFGESRKEIVAGVHVAT